MILKAGGREEGKCSMEPRVFGCGLIMKGILYCGKEFGLYVISKKYLEAASKMVPDMLRSVL